MKPKETFNGEVTADNVVQFVRLNSLPAFVRIPYTIYRSYFLLNRFHYSKKHSRLVLTKITERFNPFNPSCIVKFSQPVPILFIEQVLENFSFNFQWFALFDQFLISHYQMSYFVRIT